MRATSERADEQIEPDDGGSRAISDLFRASAELYDAWMRTADAAQVTEVSYILDGGGHIGVIVRPELARLELFAVRANRTAVELARAGPDARLLN